LLTLSIRIEFPNEILIPITERNPFFFRYINPFSFVPNLRPDRTDRLCFVVFSEVLANRLVFFIF
ncbi:MAG: hypothetical protein ACRDL7_09080, partial [Gaiellaceae bacterium]